MFIDYILIYYYENNPKCWKPSMICGAAAMRRFPRVLNRPGPRFFVTILCVYFLIPIC